MKKSMLILPFLFTLSNMSAAHAQEAKRIPASIKNVGVPCGLKGSIDKRIRDCSSQLTSKKEGFVLVTRTKDFKEVYKETKTGLLWGDRLPSTMTHIEAERECNAGLAEVAKITEVTWRLPTREEYAEAEKNGIIKALPNMYDWFWSSSVHRSYPNYTWVFIGGIGYTGKYVPYYSFYSVRCVGR